MRLFITTGVPSFRKVTNGSAHIDFCEAGPRLSTVLGSSQKADVWICSGREVDQDLLDLWLGGDAPTPKVLFVEDAAKLPRLEAMSGGRVTSIIAFPAHHSSNLLCRAESLLREAEVLFARAHAFRGVASKAAGDGGHAGGKDVVLVGAGIMNLIIAEQLIAHGFQVRIVDAGPHPLFCKDWKKLGVTSGGGNARMFTHTEADNYNEKGSEIYRDMRFIFRRTVREGGWSVKSPTDFTAVEDAWVQEFEKVPPWLARAFREDIQSVNRQAGGLWQELMKTAPELFEDVHLRHDILRMYVEPEALDAACQLHQQLGVMENFTTLEEFLEAHPGFSAAAKSDELAGAFTVDGFTVNIHAFIAKLIGRLTNLGAQFNWDCRVDQICRNEDGHVTMLKSQHGLLTADHFVVSPGVTGNALLQGTASHNLIQGVLGVWLQIPNVRGELQNSIKIHRRGHLVEDINVTVAKDTETGEDILVLGGGYGYVGLDRPAPDCPELKSLFGELEQVARIYFPQGHLMAQEGENLWPGGNFRFCVRPFTATGLGVFEKLPTASGGSMVITGGNNTGGFAQSPAIARAVQKALVGEQDPIHVLFHPVRGRLPINSGFAMPRVDRVDNVPQTPAAMKLLLLCSDSPQHRYLRYRVQQAYPNHRCVVETSEGQSRHLVQKGRYTDAAWMGYHGLRRQLFGLNHERKAYFDRLVPQDYTCSPPDLTVDSLNCRAVWDAVEEWQPDLTIVSGTKYIGRKLNERGGLMINLHIGQLPEYKGNHCIFFALYDGAVNKVAATLHQLTPHLDGGNVLDVVYPAILPSDNEERLYSRCLRMAIDRCLEHVEVVSRGRTLTFLPQKGDGATYRHCDRTPLKELALWWHTAWHGLPSKASSV